MSRIVRHWKQKFDPSASFIFTRGTKLEDGLALVGSTVPEYLRLKSHRMKIWWNANRIALRDWDYALGIPKEPELPYDSLGGAWFLFPDGEKVHGKKALEAKLASLV